MAVINEIDKIDGMKLHLGWLGDSRAVLEKNGKLSYETPDHKPFTDKARIEKNTQCPVIAWKEKKGDDPFWTLVTANKNEWNEEVKSISVQKDSSYNYYLANDILPVLDCFGWLNVPRSIGDKKNKRDYPGLISVEADTKTIQLSDKNSFLALVCDGVCDVLSSKDIVDIVTKAFKENITSINSDPRKPEELCEEDGNDIRCLHAARRLRDEAFEKGSTDNISAMIIKFWGGYNAKVS